MCSIICARTSTNRSPIGTFRIYRTTVDYYVSTALVRSYCDAAVVFHFNTAAIDFKVSFIPRVVSIVDTLSEKFTGTVCLPIDCQLCTVCQQCFVSVYLQCCTVRQYQCDTAVNIKSPRNCNRAFHHAYRCVVSTQLQISTLACTINIGLIQYICCLANLSSLYNCA